MLISICSLEPIQYLEACGFSSIILSKMLNRLLEKAEDLSIDLMEISFIELRIIQIIYF